MATLKRWFEIFVYVVVATIILLPFIGLIRRFGQLSLWEKEVYLFLASTAMWYLLVQLGGFRLRHFLHVLSFIKYPPLWFGTLVIFVGLLLLFEVRRMEDIVWLFYNTQYEFVAIILGFVVGLYFSRSKKSEKKIKIPKSINQAVDGITELLKDKEKFIKWLDEEAPIKSQDKDLFHFELQAEKLAVILKEQPAKSIGLVGQYGCGKSSLLNLVKSHLYEDRKNIVSTIGAWGFREGKAVELVLEHITEDIANNIDVLSIAALPRQYQAMLSGCSNGVAKIISGSFMPRKPREILEKIDSLLDKTGFRVVVFLEDLDRNLQQNILFEEVAMLLDSIHHLKRITFILAIGNHNEAQQLLTRLCEYIENIAPLNKQEVVQVIDVFRTWYMEEYRTEDIVSTDKRNQKFGAHRGDEYKVLLAVRNDLHPIDHAALLLRTPRALKKVLRKSKLIWSRLYGEIDFDDMFLMTILKEVAPEAYLFVNDNILDLRYVSVQHSNQGSTTKDKETEEKRNILNLRWEAIIKNVDWDKEAVQKIMMDLFPGWDKKGFERMVQHISQGEKPQGLATQEPTNYWQRFSREGLVIDEIRDNGIIRAIKEWQKNHESKVYQSQSLAEAMYRIKGFAEKIEQFGMLFSPEEIRNLASQLFDVILCDQGAEAAGDNCPGFYVLWRLSLENKFQEHADWLIKEIQKAITVSLLFAKDIYYFWRSQNKYAASSKEATPELRKQMYELFKNTFKNEPERLMSILSQSDPWGLYHIAYNYRETEEEDWSWLGEVLLSMGRNNAKMISSCIACLISNTERVHDRDGDYFKNSINYDRVKELFGENIRPVMELMREEYEYPELSDDFHHAQTRSVIKDARKEAVRWLNDNK